MHNKVNIILSFDLDNTLINNREGIVNSFNYALRKYNLPEIMRSEIEKMIGIPLDEMFSKVTDVTPSMLSSAFREYYGIEGIFQAKLLSDVKKKLGELKKLGFILGIITSKKQEMAIRVVKYLKIDSFFEYVLGETENIKSKLDPSLKKYLLEKYPSSKFIIIGDHPKDAMLSKNLNCPFIGVLTGIHTTGQLKKARENDSTTIILKSIKEITVDIINLLL